MSPLFKHIAVERQGDVFCLRLCKHQMDEPDILEMADEVVRLINKEKCRKMVLSLGPGELDCLYSVFLAKLVMIRRHLVEQGGVLKLCDACPETIGVFKACRLADFFEFVPDKATALAALGV